MATLSTCSYKFPANWEKVFFFVFVCFFFCDVKGISPIETVVFERFLCLDFDASSASVFFSTLNEIHPSLIFTMELSDAHYVGFTSRHFHQREEEHKRSKPGSHVKDEHGKDRETIERNFKILKKCQSELDCLIFEMLFIRELEPKLNKHSDSIRAKVLTLSIHF